MNMYYTQSNTVPKFLEFENRTEAVNKNVFVLRKCCEVFRDEGAGCLQLSNGSGKKMMMQTWQMLTDIWEFYTLSMQLL